MSLEYEPSSEPLHISALNPNHSTRMSLGEFGSMLKQELLVAASEAEVQLHRLHPNPVDLPSRNAVFRCSVFAEMNPIAGPATAPLQC